MGKARPELEKVTAAILKEPNRKAYEIVEETNLTETMEHEHAINYVRSVKKKLRKNGQIAEVMADPSMTHDKERMEDIEYLIQSRNGRIPKKVASLLLTLNCYYRLRSPDYTTHWNAIDHTYEANKGLKNPFTTSEAIKICENALEKYTDSIDEEKNAEARKKGFPNAGMNYSPDNLYIMLEIRDEELAQLKTIRKPEWY